MSRWQWSFSMRGVLFAAFALVPATVFAQNAEIAGVVRDSSGAVLPGVTVEASSPALIEKSRTVFTDTQGQYRIIALSPGHLSGHLCALRLQDRGARRDRADGAVHGRHRRVDGGRVARGNDHRFRPEPARRRSGDDAAPRAHRRADQRAADRRSFQNLAILVPGVQAPLIYQDVGGSDGNRWQTLTVHGSRDDQMPLLLNGMRFNNMNNTGGGYNHTLAINTGTVQEMTVTTSGSTAEAQVERRAGEHGGQRRQQPLQLLASTPTSPPTGSQADNLRRMLRDLGL